MVIKIKIMRNMKLIKYTLSILFLLMIVTSCEKNETQVVFEPALAISGSVRTPAAIVLQDATKGENLPAFTWSASNYGFNSSVSYVVEMCLAGNNFVKTKILGSVSTNSLIIKGTDLQLAMTFLGATLGVAQSVQMRVKSSISTLYTPLVSPVVTFSVTTYKPAEIEYNKVWIVGDYCGWDHSKAQYLYDITGEGKFFEGWVSFVNSANSQLGAAQNGFKITYTSGWNGDDVGSNDSQVVNNKINIAPGSDIKLFSGRIMYLKLDNTSQSARTLERLNTLTRLGVVGSATPSGWGSPDVELSFNSATKKWQALNVTLTTGEIKFRANDAWDLSWGTYPSSANKNPDQLTSSNGNNIAVTAGRYNIYFSLNKVDPTYEIVPAN